MSLDLAIKYAKKNPIKARGRNSISRFAAVLSDGRTYFVGTNSYRSHTLQAFFSKNQERICRHAEVDAISQAIRAKSSERRFAAKGPYRDLSGYTMYVARVLANGKPALAKPCEICMKAIEYFKVGNLEFTT